VVYSGCERERESERKREKEREREYTQDVYEVGNTGERVWKRAREKNTKTFFGV